MAGRAKQIDTTQVIMMLGIVLVGIAVGFLMTKVSSTLVLGAALGITLFLVCFVWPPIALYVLIFSMLFSPEFGARSTHGEGFTLRVDDLLLVIITFSWFAKSAVHKELGLFPKTPVNRIIAVYLLSCVLSTIMGGLFGKVNIIGFVFIAKYFEYFVVLFLTVNYVHTKKDIKIFTALLLITSGIICLYCLVQIPSGGRLTAPFEGEGGEPGTLGGYLLLTMSVSLGIYLTSESRRLKMLLLALIGLSLLCIVATGSRGTWMGLPFSIMCFLIWSKKRLLVLGALVLLIAASPFIIPASMKERYSGTFEKEQGAAQTKIGGKTMALDSSSSERVNSWLHILRDIKKHPLLGFGVTGYGFIDSQYFRTLIELGILGFSIFMYFMYVLFRFILDTHHIVSGNFEKGLTLGLLAGFASLLAHSLSSNTFIVVRIMEPFWFFVGLVVVLYYIEKKDREEATLQDEKLSIEAAGTK